MEEKQEQSLEEVFIDLEDIIKRMEQNDLPLDESFSLYEQGIHKLKLCNQKIDSVEKKMLILNEKGNLE